MSLLYSYKSNSSIPNTFNIKDKFQISETRWIQIWMATSEQQNLTGTGSIFLVLGAWVVWGFFGWLLVGLFFGWFGFVLLFNVMWMLESPSFWSIRENQHPRTGTPFSSHSQALAAAMGCNTLMLFYPHGKRFNLIREKWSQNASILYVKRLILLWIRSSTMTHGPANFAAVHGVLSNRWFLPPQHIPLGFSHLHHHHSTKCVPLQGALTFGTQLLGVLPSSHLQSNNRFEFITCFLNY